MNNPDGENNYEIKHIIYAILGVSLLVYIFFSITQNEEPIKEKVKIIKQNKIKDLPKNIQAKDELKEENFTQVESLTIQKQNKEVAEKTNNFTMVKDFAKCYDLGEGSYIINYQCKQNILNYIKKHKDAKYFEIIGIVDNLEFKFYKNLEANDYLYEQLDITKHSVELMKKLTESGLAKNRAVEASWIIKANTNHKAITYNPHYHIISTEGKRGVLVRAYK
jgi:hypothetical protein